MLPSLVPTALILVHRRRLMDMARSLQQNLIRVWAMLGRYPEALEQECPPSPASVFFKALVSQY